MVHLSLPSFRVAHVVLGPRQHCACLGLLGCNELNVKMTCGIRTEIDHNNNNSSRNQCMCYYLAIIHRQREGQRTVRVRVCVHACVCSFDDHNACQGRISEFDDHNACDIDDDFSSDYDIDVNYDAHELDVGAGVGMCVTVGSGAHDDADVDGGVTCTARALLAQYDEDDT